MKKIATFRQLQIAALVGVWGASALAATGKVATLFFIRGELAHVGAFLFFWFFFGVVGYRILLALIPLRQGDFAPGSKEEWVFQVVHLPFNFFLFDPIIRCGLIPTPFTGILYRLFGARLGKNTFPGRCTIFDPLLVRIGDSVTLGHHSTLVPHIIEGERMGCFSIQIEDGATIGVNAVILAGVTIGKGAVVAAGAVVPKFTCIGPHEIWGGLPARRIGFTHGTDETTPGELVHSSAEDEINRATARPIFPRYPTIK